MKREGLFLDWLEFTYKPNCERNCDLFAEFCRDFPEIEKLIYSDGCVLLDKGMNGYTFVFAYTDEFKVLYNPDLLRQGVHVIFNGAGMYRLCDLFHLESVNNFASVQSLFQRLEKKSCRPTRLDVCFDDYDKVYQPSDFNYFMITHRLLSKFRQWSFIGSQQTQGHTFYLGSRAAGRYLRIYDKDYESKGKIKSIRYEFELRGDFCRAFFNQVISGQKFSFGEMISSMFQVVNEYEYDVNISYAANASRKRDAGIDEKWSNFVKSHVLRNVLHVDKEKHDVSLERVYSWADQQLLPSLYILYRSLGWEEFQHFVESGRYRLNNEQQAMLSKYIDEVSSGWRYDVNLDSYSEPYYD